MDAHIWKIANTGNPLELIADPFPGYPYICPGIRLHGIGRNMLGENRGILVFGAHNLTERG
jgi:hypothetical protein